MSLKRKLVDSDHQNNHSLKYSKNHRRMYIFSYEGQGDPNWFTSTDDFSLENNFHFQIQSNDYFLASTTNFMPLYYHRELVTVEKEIEKPSKRITRSDSRKIALAEENCFILNLPKDIILSIFAFLEIQSSFNFAMSCKTFYKFKNHVQTRNILAPISDILPEKNILPIESSPEDYFAREILRTHGVYLIADKPKSPVKAVVDISLGYDRPHDVIASVTWLQCFDASSQAIGKIHKVFNGDCKCKFSLATSDNIILIIKEAFEKLKSEGLLCYYVKDIGYPDCFAKYLQYKI